MIHGHWALGSHPSHHFEESEESCEEPKIGAKNVNKGSWYEVHDTQQRNAGIFWTLAQKNQGEKTETQAKKTSKLKNFLPKTQNASIFFSENQEFLSKKSGKIVQKLKNLP